jgi:hypothetical protein
MKKFSIISILFLTAAHLPSCSKESTSAEAVLVPSPPPLSPSPQPIKIVSRWFSPSFSIINDRSTVYLKAHQDHEAPMTYDRATHTELAFVKLNYQGTSITRRLPVLLSCSHLISIELCEINFGLSNAGCEVIIRNADRNSSPVITANPFSDMQIRYIVIPKTLFESLSINWDDYAVVAQALNI